MPVSAVMQIDELFQRGLVEDLDRHLAVMMLRLDPAADERLAWAVLLLSQASREGHVCISIPQLAGTPAWQQTDEPGVTLPQGADWLQALQLSPLVGNDPADEAVPLVLDRDGRFYLSRYWQYETNLAKALLRLSGGTQPPVDEARLRQGLARLFDRQSAESPDRQKLAAALAVYRRLAVISGGPGTGKTSTVVRLLALLLEQSPDRLPRIALAAPTGKAAARMQEAIRRARDSLAVTEEIREAIPAQATTLHRLLGVKPKSIHFRHNADNPLPLDILVVDEASMVDLALMAKLLDALDDRARLILLGDRDQLASVEAGSVMADICGQAPGFSAAFADSLSKATGEAVGGEETAEFADSVIELRHSYRFGADSGIGRLAQAINQGDDRRALALCKNAQYADLQAVFEAQGAALVEEVRRDIVEAYRPYRQAKTIEDAYAAFESYRVLCAHWQGNTGVDVLNRRVESLLTRAGLIKPEQIWYEGRPVMMIRNDYSLGLFNGDIGLTLPDSEGHLRVWFPKEDGGFRALSPMQLGEHQTVFAMTVHKSQGSEFDRVLCLLPDRPSAVLSRELLYTAVTRAKNSVLLAGPSGVFQGAVRQRMSRDSGLADQLWGKL